MTTFPLLVQAIREAIGDDKVLSIATPGLKRDMIGYTADNGPTVFDTVDMVNIMSYDLMNRRDNVTKHHTSIDLSLSAVDAYISNGAAPRELNLGFAFYTKYFRTEHLECTKHASPIISSSARLRRAHHAHRRPSGQLSTSTRTLRAQMCTSHCLIVR